MRLFSEFAAMLENDKQPMYVAVRPDEHAIKTFRTMIRAYGIPHPVTDDSMHCTLIYSKKPTAVPDIQPHILYNATIDKFDIFKTRDGKCCLVAKLNSVDLQARHLQLMNDLDASYDFPTYVAHITLSYDCGDFDLDVLNQTLTAKPIYLTGEYYEVLDQNWDASDE